MAKNAIVVCADGVWTEITDAATDAAAVQNTGGHGVRVHAGAAAPTDADAGFVLHPGAGLIFPDHFPGTGSAVRLFARPSGGTVQVAICHA